jgi:protein CpxP
MKKLLLMCCVVMGISAASHAQGRQQMSPADRAAQLKTSLALTDDQTTKITAIYAAQTKSMDSLRSAGGDMSAMRPMMTATNAKVKAVLTPDQAAAFDKQQAARMQRQQQGGGGAPPKKKK